MRKVMLGLVMVMMVMSLVGCGETKKFEDKEGFVPEQVTESEVVTDDVKDDIEEVIDTQNLQKYYNVEKYLGTPSLIKCECSGGSVEGTMNLIGSAQILNTETQECEDRMITLTIEKNDNLEYWKIYNVIVCDNNTPTDLTDDVVAYVFTTPIE